MSHSFIQNAKQFYWNLFPRIAQLKLRYRLNSITWRNRITNTPVTTQDGDAVVSLTTYGERIKSVYMTIESIGAGTVRPRRIILWLDEEVQIGPQLQRLVERGLEIKKCENFGPHKKYYPYVESETQFVFPLVTADDDVLYPPDWLERLSQAHKSEKNVVQCYRARNILLTDDGLAPYIEWPLCTDTQASFSKMATGVSGVLYPASLQQVLKERGRVFLSQCPRADDLWLHVTALRHNFPVRQLDAIAADYDISPGTQEISLSITNQFGGENDRQIRQTYTHQDFLALRVAVESMNIKKEAL